MRPFLLLLSSLILLSAWPVQGRIVKIRKVHWADCLETEKGEMVHLLGIRAPLKGEPSGIEATEFVKGILRGRQIDLQSDSSSIELLSKKGSSLFAYVFLVCDTCEGSSLVTKTGKTNEFSFHAKLVNINTLLLEKGFALLDSTQSCSKTGYFRFLEKTARNAKVGYWK
ncbi:MAG: hypothetical protein A2293_06485 [Elusimicrobia bacterium RIFOXYB2_FULL_49_7]|nr:MAG: hypothetical protein A2293_06485 [Elusimicrobia bacterium RIFOXYB2_FULL_49_7]